MKRGRIMKREESKSERKAEERQEEEEKEEEKKENGKIGYTVYVNNIQLVRTK